MGEEMKQNATASLQALERLNLHSRNLPDSKSNSQLKDKIHAALDQLRDIKTMVDGCCDDFVPLSVDDGPLTELKQLLLMHVPSSITDTARAKFSQLIEQALSGRCQKVLAAVVLTCPWYSSTQKERGEQAKHNVLLVVVMNDDRQFFSPSSLHVKEMGAVVDLGWLRVMELSHYGRLLASGGRRRTLEALVCDKQTLVHSSEEWRRLQETLPVASVTGLRSFLEACVNQALGGISKKKKGGGMKLKADATMAQICESFRLLHHAHNHHLGLPPVSNGLSQSDLPDVASQALDMLKALYKTEGEVSKEDIVHCLVSWHGQLRDRMKACVFTDPHKVMHVVGHWMMETRLQGRVLPSPLAAAPEDSSSRLPELMGEIGGPVSRMTSDQILLVARAGSYMYGLSTPDSDVDYLVVYRENTQTVLSACSKPSECRESRGPNKKVEYGAYEVRLLCEMLIKCSVVILELVYVGEHDYVSPLWRQLHEQREKFVTELAIQQYLGLVKNNFHMIHSGKHRGNTGRERKLFYQIFHKMDSVRYMMAGAAPPVRVAGPVRDFIMDVRTKPLEGHLSRESILKKATTEFEDLRRQLAHRQTRLPEKPDFRFVTDWILSVRGDIFTSSWSHPTVTEGGRQQEEVGVGKTVETSCE